MKNEADFLEEFLMSPGFDVAKKMCIGPREEGSWKTQLEVSRDAALKANDLASARYYAGMIEALDRLFNTEVPAWVRVLRGLEP